MIHELKHRAYRPTIGGRAVPSTRLINDLGKDAIFYIGTYSEYNPIGIVETGHTPLTATICKSTNTILPQKEFILPGFKLQRGLSYHGTEFNNNGSIKFDKQDLLRIAHAMDDSDGLIICSPDSLDRNIFEENVNKVCKT